MNLIHRAKAILALSSQVDSPSTTIELAFKVPVSRPCLCVFLSFISVSVCEAFLRVRPGGPGRASCSRCSTFISITSPLPSPCKPVSPAFPFPRWPLWSPFSCNYPAPSRMAGIVSAQGQRMQPTTAHDPESRVDVYGPRNVVFAF